MIGGMLRCKPAAKLRIFICERGLIHYFFINLKRNQDLYEKIVDVYEQYMKHYEDN